MDWFLVSIFCAFSLAASDSAAKKYLTDYSNLQLLLIRFFIPGVLLVPVLYFNPLADVPWEFWGWLSILLPLELIAMTLYMQSIQSAPLYQTLPYLAFTPVFNIATGGLILGESVSVTGGAGILMVVLGAYLLNIHHANRHVTSWLEPLKAIFYQKGSRMMLAAAIIYSFTSVGGKAAMQYTDPISFGSLYFVLLGFITLILILLSRPADILILTQRPLAHLLVGGFMAVMVVTHFIALSLVQAAYMIAVKRTSLLFGITFGAIFFNEKGLLKNLLYVGVMLCGTVLILFAQ